MEGKRGFVAALAVLTLLSVPVLSRSTSEKKAPPAEGKAVYTYVTQTDSYKAWDLWPGKGELYTGKHPHGAFLTTYVSKDALKTITDKSGMFPEGAVIVKENYNKEKKLAAVTVMYRVKGYNPEAGDWFWAKYGADGSIQKEGMVKGCIGCHQTKIENDWVFTGDVK
jgi:hypothetical protein